MKKANSYNQIAKATGIFGGVQFINILISVVRSKFIAVILGASGVGIMGLFTVAISMITSITGLGLSFSAVRTISASAGSEDHGKVSRTIITLRRWVNFTGIFGAVLTLVLASNLSNWTFGNEKYTWAFVWLSITLFLQALNSGQLALLQGLRMIKNLAKANIIGSFIGLCLSLPLYYWLSLDGIVPAIIITAAINLSLSWYFSKEVKVDSVNISFKESFADGIDMVKLGNVVMITGFITTGVMYLIRMYIGKNGNMEEVGLYTAAWSIINGYVGMIFTAMATDYFPRLTSLIADNTSMNVLVNEQGEIAILILGPILILLLSSLPIFITILLTAHFLPIIDLIQWAILGVFFKAASWPIGFIMLAKGNKKMYFTSEIISNIIILVSNVMLYHYWGLQGIGLAFTISYIFVLVIVYMITNINYGFNFKMPFIRLFSIQFSLSCIALVMVWQFGFPLAYFSGGILLLISASYSFYELNKRMDLISFLSKKKKTIVK